MPNSVFKLSPCFFVSICLSLGPVLFASGADSTTTQPTEPVPATTQAAQASALSADVLAERRKQMTAVTKVFNIDLKAQDFEDARVKFNEMTKLAEGMPAEDRDLLLHQELRLEAFSGNKDRTLALARQMQAGAMAPVRRQFVVQSLLANPDLGPEIAKLGEEILMKHPSRDSALCLSLRARARFLQGDKESAIALQQQALAAAPEEKRALFEEELKNYRDGKLPPVSFTR